MWLPDEKELQNNVAAKALINSIVSTISSDPGALLTVVFPLPSISDLIKLCHENFAGYSKSEQGVWHTASRLVLKICDHLCYHVGYSVEEKDTHQGFLDCATEWIFVENLRKADFFLPGTNKEMYVDCFDSHPNIFPERHPELCHTECDALIWDFSAAIDPNEEKWGEKKCQRVLATQQERRDFVGIIKRKINWRWVKSTLEQRRFRRWPGKDNSSNRARPRDRLSNTFLPWGSDNATELEDPKGTRKIQNQSHHGCLLHDRS